MRIGAIKKGYLFKIGLGLESKVKYNLGPLPPLPLFLIYFIYKINKGKQRIRGVEQ